MVVMEFDHPAIQAAFQHKGLNQRCPACNETPKWGVGAVFVLPALDQPTEGAATATQTGEEIRMPGAAVAPRICLTCGHAQLFDVSTLLQG